MEERELEDPFIWRTDDEYEMIVKDMDGRICGQRGGGVHAFSEDGLHWAPQKGVLAYSKEVLWDDGKGVAWSAPSCCLKMGRRPTLFCDLQWRRRLQEYLEHGHSFEGVGMKRQSEIFQRTKEKQYPGGKKPPDSGKIRQPGGGFFEGVPSLFLCICPARHFILKAALSLPPAW